jgi:tripeptide aminopeptidase
MNINSEELLSRFLKYVTIDTQADPDSTTYPSSPGQLVLGKMLCDELHQLGLTDAEQDKFGLVYATIPATVSSKVPTIAWNAHVDTSPEAPGKDVRPQVIRNYAGGDIRLPGDPTQVILVERNPDLNSVHGKTLVTTDGTTLLGGDDKAGVAIIMQTAATLMRDKSIPHGPIRILFTCDEEIGHGVDHVDLKKLGAEACYTLDGPAANSVDIETFSADLATVTISGINCHPSVAKGRMINAIKGMAKFIDLLPAEMSPEMTSECQGFVHPYQLQGHVDQAVVQVLLRDFEAERLGDQAKLLRDIGSKVEQAVPGCRVEIKVMRQYRNMRDGLQSAPHVVEYAKQAHAALGRSCRLEMIRGGTDGSRLTELGLPTPNLSSGQHNLHSLLEWACLDEMSQACELLIALAKVWAGKS